jgi:hypothetical protein
MLVLILLKVLYFINIKYYNKHKKYELLDIRFSLKSYTYYCTKNKTKNNHNLLTVWFSSKSYTLVIQYLTIQKQPLR